MQDQIKRKIDAKTKPVGALGQLETLATQICAVQQTLTPKLTKPTILVFAADHGIAREGVSAYPPEVTSQMVLNFLAGGAAINVFSRQNGIELKIIDAGVNHDFGATKGLIDRKVAKGTHSFLGANAMSMDQLDECLSYGRRLVSDTADGGCNVIGFGEMGIGNTSAASMLMSALCDLPLTACVGRGAGLDDAGLQRKIDTLETARALHDEPRDAYRALTYFGGFEIAQICGGMLAAHERGMVILVDGFIATAAYLCARDMEPAVAANAVFCHQSDERGHQKILDYLGAEPVLSLGLRLGEGTGCALAYPILRAAVGFVNDMASFESAGVSKRS